MDEGAPKPNNPKEENEKIDLRIIVADDDEQMGPFLKNMLSIRYTSVDHVENGKLLVEKLLDPNQNFDFIITDNTMPEMTGLEAVKKIRSMGGKFETIPIIMCSSDGGSLRSNVEKLGVFFLAKPYGMNDLYAAIERMRSK